LEIKIIDLIQFSVYCCKAWGKEDHLDWKSDAIIKISAEIRK